MSNSDSEWNDIEDEWSDIEDNWDIPNNNIIDLNTNNLDIKVIHEENYRIIKLKNNSYSSLFKNINNISINELNILISYTENYKIFNINVYIENKETKTDILILNKLNNKLKNINIDLSNNFISKINDIISEFFNNDIFNKCFLCEKININENHFIDNCFIINICNDLKCIFNSYIFSEDIVNDELKNQKNRLELMLYLFTYSCYINRIPSILPENTNLMKILNLIKKLDSLNNINFKLYNNLDNELKSLISWLIVKYKYSQKIHFFKEEYDMKNKVLKYIYQINENNIIKDEKFKNADIKRIFNKYHGSSDYNYFNILMNGLQVFSNTELQTNGSAYGKGIYFGEQYVAKSYNNNNNISFHKNNKNYKIYKLLIKSNINKCIKLLNCDIFYENDNWENNNFCTVIPDENNIKIKYLIIYKKIND